MSFGFSVGDFVGTAQLAFNLYRYCYKIARDAPQEFKLLVTELGTIRAFIELLVTEAQDPESTLASGGEERARSGGELFERVQGTLKALQKHAEKFGKLESSRPGLKRAWAQFRWSVDASDLDALRNQVCLYRFNFRYQDTMCLTLHSWFITMG